MTCSHQICFWHFKSGHFVFIDVKSLFVAGLINPISHANLASLHRLVPEPANELHCHFVCEVSDSPLDYTGRLAHGDLLFVAGVQERSHDGQHGAAGLGPERREDLVNYRILYSEITLEGPGFGDKLCVAYF